MQQVFTHNRFGLNGFAAELVFRYIPGKFLSWDWNADRFGVGIGCGLALIDAVGGVAGVAPPPVCEDLLAADGLAFRIAADALPVAHPWIGIELPSTIPAGALPQSGHPYLSACLAGGQLFAGRGE